MRFVKILGVSALLSTSAAYADRFDLGDGSNLDLYGDLKFTAHEYNGDSYYVFAPNLTANIVFNPFSSSGIWGLSFESGGFAYGTDDIVSKSIGLYGSVFFDNALGRTYLGKPKSAFSPSDYIVGHFPNDLATATLLDNWFYPDGIVGLATNVAALGAYGLRHEFEVGELRGAASALRASGPDFEEFALSLFYALPFGGISAGYSHFDQPSGTQDAYALAFFGNAGPVSYGLGYNRTISDYDAFSAFVNYQISQQWSAEGNILKIDTGGTDETNYSVSAIYALNESVDLRAFYTHYDGSDLDSYGLETTVSFGNHLTGEAGNGGVNVEIDGDVQIGFGSVDTGSTSQSIYTFAPNADVAISFDNEGNTSSGPSMGLSFEIDGGAFTPTDSLAPRGVTYNPSIFFDNQLGRTYVGSPEDSFARAQYVTEHVPNGYFRYLREIAYVPNSGVEHSKITNSYPVLGIRHDGTVGNLDYSVSALDVGGVSMTPTEYSASASYQLATQKFGELDLMFAMMFGDVDGYMAGIAGNYNQIGYGFSHRQLDSSGLKYKSTAGFLNYQINDMVSTELYVEKIDTPSANDTYTSVSVKAEVAPGTDISAFAGSFGVLDEFGVSLRRSF